MTLFLFHCQLSLFYPGRVSSRLYYELLLFLHITKTCYTPDYEKTEQRVSLVEEEKGSHENDAEGDAIDNEFYREIMSFRYGTIAFACRKLAMHLLLRVLKPIARENRSDNSAVSSESVLAICRANAREN